MEIVFFLFPAALLIALGFLWAFIWAVKSGQFKDTTTPAYRILLDDENDNPSDKKNTRK